MLELDYSTSIEEIKTELRKNIQNIELSYNLIKIDLKKSVMQWIIILIINILQYYLYHLYIIYFIYILFILFIIQYDLL